MKKKKSSSNYYYYYYYDEDGDDDNSSSNNNNFKIIQEIPAPHTGKAQNKGTTANSLTGHCTHTSESTNVKVQNIKHEK
jgi:hypothetical protein